MRTDTTWMVAKFIMAASQSRASASGQFSDRADAAVIAPRIHAADQDCPDTEVARPVEPSGVVIQVSASAGSILA